MPKDGRPQDNANPGLQPTMQAPWQHEVASSAATTNENLRGVTPWWGEDDTADGEAPGTLPDDLNHRYMEYSPEVVGVIPSMVPILNARR
jgi:hypothetical protein